MDDEEAEDVGYACIDTIPPADVDAPAKLIETVTVPAPAAELAEEDWATLEVLMRMGSANAEPAELDEAALDEAAPEVATARR